MAFLDLRRPFAELQPETVLPINAPELTTEDLFQAYKAIDRVILGEFSPNDNVCLKLSSNLHSSVTFKLAVHF